MALISKDSNSSSTVDDEKATVSVRHREQGFSGPVISQDDADFLAGFSETQRKRVLRKIDLRLVPMLTLLYLVSYIDRANIGNAKIEGLLPSLNLSGTQYNIALAIFFVPYVLFELPSNIVLHKFARPSFYMGSIVLLWSIVMTCTGFVQNFEQLVAMRVLLGLFEAGFFPGAILILSKWYMPNESQVRIAIFFCSSALAGAFSGLLAFAIVKMDGVGGYEGWRWIFILEGIASVVVAIATYWLLVDLPANSTSWLAPEEIRYLELRQYAAGRVKPKGHKDKPFDWSILRSVLLDWKIALLTLGFWSNAVPGYALKFSLPTIVKGMGFTSANAQLLTIPPYFIGGCSAIGLGLLADKFTWRMPPIVGAQICVVVAYAVLCGVGGEVEDNIGVTYFAICLACFGTYAILPGVLAWNQENLAGPVKRAMGIALLTGLGNLGGIPGSFIFLDNEAPAYPTGYGASLGFAFVGALACLGLEFALWYVNRRDGKMSEDEVGANFTAEELDRMGDKSPLFRYTL